MSEANGHTASDTESGESTPDMREGKHARFNIEKVSLEERHQLSPLHENHHTHHDITDTIGYATHEAVPLTVFYRNEASVAGNKRNRPTLAALHQGFDELDEQADNVDTSLLNKEDDVEQGGDPKIVTKTKFGWIQGVLIPCLLNIWGVMLYLRLPWLTGQAGILVMTAIILLSAVVTTITTLSMSAICTNGEVKGGGAYYLISRSLGPEFGGSIGIIFSLASAVGVALYVVGFSEVLQKLMERSGYVMFDSLNDVRVIGSVIIVILLLITLVGLDWVIKTQLFLLGILLVSIFNYVIGTFSGNVLTPDNQLKAEGFTSYSKETFNENLFPEFRGENFFTTFSIFFPAATGILAGVNISGDLKDPPYSVPKGTIAAVVISTAVYIALAWIIGATTLKDAPGLAVLDAVISTISPAATNSSVLNATALLPTVLTNTTIASTVTTSGAPACIPNCKYGLLNDYQAMERCSMFGPLVLAGTFAATLSSALASLVGSPKTFQAVCRDNIFKGLSFFGVGSGPNDEPRRAYVLTFFIALAFILVGRIDSIAPIISTFFLMSYALINYSVFASSLAKSPGWRPAFKYYNMWLSLFGCLVCVGIMFLINWWAALVTILLITFLYKYVDYMKPAINWGSSGQAQVYQLALRLTHQLNETDAHVKNFRPQCLVLTGCPSDRPNLAQFVHQITKQAGLMVCGQVLVRSESGGVDINTTSQEKWLREKRIKAFMSITTATSLREGVLSLMQCSGLGKMRANIVVLGFKQDWQNSPGDEVNEYTNIVYDCFDSNVNVAILRMPRDREIVLESDVEGQTDDKNLDNDLSTVAGTPQKTPEIACKEIGENGKITQETDQTIQEDTSGTLETNPNEAAEKDTSGTPKVLTTAALRKQTPCSSPETSGTPKVLTTAALRKQTPCSSPEETPHKELMGVKQHGVIDVWWLFDDGGLTMLLPYLLSRNKVWSSCSLRVFTPATEKKLKSNQIRMANLLNKFRIKFDEVVEVQGVNSKPSPESIEKFCRLGSGAADGQTDGEESCLDKKTLRQIRLGELVRENSSDARLVVMTMPVPRKTVVSNLTYMKWLEVISMDLTPPVLFVRGNQTNVLTFYS